MGMSNAPVSQLGVRKQANGAKKGVKNGLLQTVFGHFVLRIQDGGCYAKLVFANGPIGFLQSMGHQWDANEPLLSHIASSGTLLWAFSCQKTANFALILDTDDPKPRTDHILGYTAQNF